MSIYSSISVIVVLVNPSVTLRRHGRRSHNEANDLSKENYNSEVNACSIL